MITIVQRVTRAEVRVLGECVGRIDRGAVLLVGVEGGDTVAEALATARKVAALRFFPGRTPMDLTLAEVGGGCLVVSQFTLAAALLKGNRPSFVGAAVPELARQLYQRVADQLAATGLTVAMGTFAAEMVVELVNDGPVTFVLQARGGRIVDQLRPGEPP